MAGVSSSCEGCHAGAAEHLASAGDADIFNFGGSAAENSQACLTCHSDNHSRYANSDHAKARARMPRLSPEPRRRAVRDDRLHGRGRPR